MDFEFWIRWRSRTELNPKFIIQIQKSRLLLPKETYLSSSPSSSPTPPMKVYPDLVLTVLSIAIFRAAIPANPNITDPKGQRRELDDLVWQKLEITVDKINSLTTGSLPTKITSLTERLKTTTDPVFCKCGLSTSPTAGWDRRWIKAVLLLF